MSGICGIVRLDGGPAEGVEAMTTLLERRGPDATRLWTESSVALAHTLLATTPEALHESLPLVHPETGCVVTADVRLDNREDLLRALGLAELGRTLGDGELILRSYVAWGESCVDHLLGDFAFAIWDPRSRRLFAARDHAGLRPFAYAHVQGQVVAFASEPRAVIEAGGVPRDIDEGRIADYLDYADPADPDITFFSAVRRLPKAHILLADSRGITIRRYWSLEPGPPLKLGSDRAFAEGFLEVFTEAVRCRLRSPGPVGSMLSGGLDSGSAVAVASRLLTTEGRGPLHTFSITSPDPAHVETQQIRQTLTLPGLEPHLINFGNLSAWEADLLDAIAQVDQPGDAGWHLFLAIYLEAQRAGVRVVLDGASGDNVLNWTLRLPRLIRSGRIISAWREAVKEERHWAGAYTRWSLLRRATATAAPMWLRRIQRRLALGKAGLPAPSLLSPDFARKINPAARAEARRRLKPPLPAATALSRAQRMVTQDEAVGFEALNRLASSFNVEPRSPFIDLRVVSYALRCPLDQMISEGWTKALLRRALTGLLPDEVIWQVGKSHPGLPLTASLFDHRQVPPPNIAGTSIPAQDLFQYVTGVHRAALTGLPLDNDRTRRLWYLALWLDATHR